MPAVLRCRLQGEVVIAFKSTKGGHESNSSHGQAAACSDKTADTEAGRDGAIAPRHKESGVELAVAVRCGEEESMED